MARRHRAPRGAVKRGRAIARRMIRSGSGRFVRRRRRS